MENPEAVDSVKKMIVNYSGYHWKNKDTSFGLSERVIKNLEKREVPALAMICKEDMYDYYQISKAISQGVKNGKMITLIE
ncbi:MAG: hypothetical protein HeimC2_25920 [Candidatus Heimdallarchaeota archaeon LC_2]|nr:MAG: hypothetical protein HeimC2_25920 [Candidatus Heimdallarchaeota archaeon LC_2]